MFMDRVFELSAYVEVRECFGLSVIDLFELDYASFVDIERRVEELRKLKAPKERELNKTFGLH